jgi:transcription initiation factor TFIID subunit 10
MHTSTPASAQMRKVAEHVLSHLAVPTRTRSVPFPLLQPLVHLAQDKTRTTLTMEDLSAALSEYGINARKPEFYM